jgi:hypothetical protein
MLPCVTGIDLELPALVQIVILGITVVAAKILWRRPMWIPDEQSPGRRGWRRAEIPRRES